MKTLHIGTMLCAAFAAVAANADIVAPDFASATTNVESDTTLEGRLVAGPFSYGVLKTGGGDLALDTAQLAGFGTFKLNVATGGVTVASSAAAPQAAVPAPAAMDKAALWLKADANIIYDGDGEHVASWRDARDTQTGDVWSGDYFYAVGEALALDGAQLPSVRQNDENKPMIYFHGAQSGSTM